LKSLFINPKKIILYLDQDVAKDRFFLKSLKYHSYKDVKVEFLYNKLGKDFGEEKILAQQLKV